MEKYLGAYIPSDTLFLLFIMCECQINTFMVLLSVKEDYSINLIIDNHHMFTTYCIYYNNLRR